MILREIEEIESLELRDNLRHLYMIEPLEERGSHDCGDQHLKGVPGYFRQVGHVENPQYPIVIGFLLL